MKAITGSELSEHIHVGLKIAIKQLTEAGVC
jgi:hypothetical protein